MPPIALRAGPAEVHIHADRRLAFQMLTAFGSGGGLAGASSRVLAADDGGLLVEFHTPAEGPFGRRVVYRTLERVTLHEPESIDFEAVKGGLFALLRDRLVLGEEGGCTRLCYESTFALRGGVLGWLVGRFYVRRKLAQFMHRHLEEMREAIEARAERSRAYPQRPCG